MRFNSQAYDKLFPRKTEVEQAETVVETFRPSQDEQETVVEPERVVEPEVVDPLLDEEPSTEIGGDADGNGNDD